MTTELIEVDLEALKRVVKTLDSTWYSLDNTDIFSRKVVCKYCHEEALYKDKINHLDFCGVPDIVNLKTRLFED
jgi:hypothetical protein